MTARLWRGWTVADGADEVVAYLHEGPLARFSAAPGNVSAEVLVRPLAGGVEVRDAHRLGSAGVRTRRG